MKTRRKKTGEKEMFGEIRMERKAVSELSGRSINTDDVRCYAHIIPKGSYPLYRLRKDNIMLLHPEEHRIYDAGTKSDRIKYAEGFAKCDWHKIDQKAEELKTQYIRESKTSFRID